jgi:opacity protein-like surface antigen
MNEFRRKLQRLSRYGVAAVLLALLSVSASSPALAQSTDFDRFSISLGVFLLNGDTKTQLDGQIPNSGTPVDLENDLGFDKSDSVFRVDGYFRFNEKHRLDFSNFDLSRSASKQIQEDIEWNGEFFPVDTAVDAKLNWNIYKLAYTWSFLRRDKGYLGATAGLYVADVGTSLAAESIGRSSSGGVTAPLPVFGLRGQYDLAEKWSLRGSAEIFAIEYGDYSGYLYDVYAGLDYQLTQHVAVGLGLNSVKLNLGVDKGNFSGDLDWRYDGGLLFLKFDF